MADPTDPRPEDLAHILEKWNGTQLVRQGAFGWLLDKKEVWVGDAADVLRLIYCGFEEVYGSIVRHGLHLAYKPMTYDGSAADFSTFELQDMRRRPRRVAALSNIEPISFILLPERKMGVGYRASLETYPFEDVTQDICEAWLRHSVGSELLRLIEKGDLD